MAFSLGEGRRQCARRAGTAWMMKVDFGWRLGTLTRELVKLDVAMDDGGVTASGFASMAGWSMRKGASVLFRLVSYGLLKRSVNVAYHIFAVRRSRFCLPSRRPALQRYRRQCPRRQGGSPLSARGTSRPRWCRCHRGKSEEWRHVSYFLCSHTPGDGRHVATARYGWST